VGQVYDLPLRRQTHRERRSAREHGIPIDETVARADAIRSFNYPGLNRAVLYSLRDRTRNERRLLPRRGRCVRSPHNRVTAVYARLIGLRQNKPPHDHRAVSNSPRLLRFSRRATDL
jgi:hypothetical protein